ncbi:Hypothetical predicted protein, partial [Marmota monax]
YVDACTVAWWRFALDMWGKREVSLFRFVNKHHKCGDHVPPEMAKTWLVTGELPLGSTQLVFLEFGDCMYETIRGSFHVDIPDVPGFAYNLFA